MSNFNPGGRILFLFPFLKLGNTPFKKNNMFSLNTIFWKLFNIFPYLVILVISVPSMRGDFTKHQRANIVWYSTSVMPPFPEENKCPIFCFLIIYFFFSIKPIIFIGLHNRWGIHFIKCSNSLIFKL